MRYIDIKKGNGEIVEGIEIEYENGKVYRDTVANIVEDMVQDVRKNSNRCADVPIEYMRKVITEMVYMDYLVTEIEGNVWYKDRAE